MALIQHLGRCVVRFPREPHRRAGSGFFVGPGLVLTCAHVLGEGASKGREVRVIWAGNDYAGRVEDLTGQPYPDLALVRLIAPPRHPCVRLDAPPNWQGRQGVSLALGGERIVEALKQFHQGDGRFHVQTLILSASWRINSHR